MTKDYTKKKTKQLYKQAAYSHDVTILKKLQKSGSGFYQHLAKKLLQTSSQPEVTVNQLVKPMFFKEQPLRYPIDGNKVMDSYLLTTQAKADPKIAANMLQTPTLRERLLQDPYEGGKAKNEAAEIAASYILSEIAQSQPASAILIFQDAFLRGILLNGGKVAPNACISDTLYKIAKAHPGDTKVQALCTQYRPFDYYKYSRLQYKCDEQPELSSFIP